MWKGWGSKGKTEESDGSAAAGSGASAAAVDKDGEKTFSFGTATGERPSPMRGVDMAAVAAAAASAAASTPVEGLSSKSREIMSNPYAALQNIDVQAVAPAMGVYQPRQAEYIDVGGPNSQHFEKVTYRMGLTYLAALTAGGTFGFFEGAFLGQKGNMRLRINSILNAMTRRGPKLANAAGCLTMLFCSFEWLSGMIRSEDDLFNTIVGGTLTGAFYKSLGGPKKALRAAGLGAGLGAAWATVSYIRDSDLEWNVESLQEMTEDATRFVQTRIERLKNVNPQDVVTSTSETFKELKEVVFGADKDKEEEGDESGDGNNASSPTSR